MAPDLSQELIQYLVEMGESQQFDGEEQLFARFPFSRSGRLMRLGSQPWEEVARQLDDASLVALIRTLTVLEQRLPNFRAGSVSPVIWLFRKLSERSSDDLTPFIDWIRSHTDNWYLPFGTMNQNPPFDTNNLGAKSLEELDALSALAAEHAKTRRAAEEDRQLETKTRKVAEATHKLFGALRRRDKKAVAALLSQGADIHAANEQGQTAIEYARSVGLAHILTPVPKGEVSNDAPKRTSAT